MSETLRCDCESSWIGRSTVIALRALLDECSRSVSFHSWQPIVVDRLFQSFSPVHHVRCLPTVATGWATC